MITAFCQSAKPEAVGGGVRVCTTDKHPKTHQMQDNLMLIVETYSSLIMIMTDG